MWTSSPSAIENKVEKRNQVFIREFERSDHEEVRRIFNEGIMERIPNSAFRGLKQQTRTQIIYAFLTGMWPKFREYDESIAFIIVPLQHVKISSELFEFISKYINC